MTAIKPSYYRDSDLDWYDAFGKLASPKLDPEESFLVGNIGKYNLRFPEKNGIEDVKKAFYSQFRLLKHVAEKLEQNGDYVFLDDILSPGDIDFLISHQPKQKELHSQ